MSSTLPRRGVAIALVASLTITLAAALPAIAAPYKPGSAQQEQAIPGAAATTRPADLAATGTPFASAAVVWPKATTTEINLAGTVSNRKATASGTPVSLVTTAKSGAKAKIQTFDRATSLAAGVDGVLFRVSGAEAKVNVDYSAFRWAYGGDWAGRLRLTELPECALTSPDEAECRGTVVESRNDVKRGTVSSTKNISAAGSLMALSAGTSSGSGTYAATSLTPSSTWNAGGNSGGFTWSYPLRMPPALGGPVPSLSLDYSSASVDGQMAASNNQPSWVGQGFQLASNFIERKYRSCADDMADGARNTVKTGDLCWATDNAVLSMSGHSGELIEDAETPNRWRLRNDDGTYVDHRTGVSNGAKDGEHWVVTAEGTQYWFGRTAQSTLTTQVAGNHAGEPCAAAAFKDSFCTQAYRWNLEYVVDLHGNTMTYTYAKETNKYARNGTNTDLVQYDRSAYLERIDYGTRVDRTETAPMQVVFETADRCLSDCGVHDATHWTDAPWDQACDASPCTTGSPTFWTTKRLTAITTKVGGSNVEKWTLSQSFPDPGDGTRAGLWLDGISHKGLVGTEVSVPDVRFTGIQLSNRVDTHSDQYAAMKWWRLKTIQTETGGRINVKYSEPDCVVGSRMPDQNALQDNTLRCYPVRWTPDGATDSILDFFHKYVVTGVTETDTTGGAPEVTTDYEYVGAPAWHYNDDDGLINTEDKTWSVWRGYEFVRTFKGLGADRTRSDTRYFRGMNGDELPNGNRSASLPAIAVGSIPAAPDEDAFAGVARETITYDGPAGAEVSATINEPWQSPPGASRTINGTTVHTRHTAVASTHGRTKLDGSRGFRTTTSSAVFDDTYGEQLRTEDLGDDAIVGDEKCTLFDYARNTDAWLIDTVSRKRSFVVDCAKARAGTGLHDDDITADDRIYYDGKVLGAAPTKGELSKVEKLKTYIGGTSTYLTAATSEFDVYGRAKKVTDLQGSTATTYTPALGGPVTQVVTTNSLGWPTTTRLEPAWGLPGTVTDSNQRRADVTFDGLGRTTAVWLPERSSLAGATPNKKFTYLVRNDAPVAVTTQTLNPAGEYVSSHELLDGLLRSRQTQVKDASGTSAQAVVTDTYYDTAGRPSRANAQYLSTTTPGTALFQPSAPIPTQTTTVYDGAGRTIASIAKKQAPAASPGGEEMFRTTTSYAGDRTDVTPPSGGTATSTLVDAQGRTTELRNYHPGAAVGSSMPAGFDAAKYSYNRVGKLSGVADSAGKNWTFGYDLMGRQTTSADPDKGTTTSVYDDADQLTSTTDNLGVTLAYTYDALGRKTTTRLGSATGPKRAEWVYDTTSDGTRVNGQLVKSIRYAGTSGTEAYVNETLTFTSDYKPVDTQVVIPAGEGDLAGTYPYFFAYNAARTPDTSRISAAGDLQRETLKYQYDALGQPTALLGGLGARPPTALVSATGYTSFGELGSYSMAPTDSNGVDVVREYDKSTRRLTRISTAKETAPRAIADVGYSYDDAGNITKIADTVSNDIQCFRNDYLQRLTEAWTPASGDCTPDPAAAALGGPAKYWQSYSYNTVGDRTKLVDHATAAGNRTTTYTPNPGKHSTSGTSTTDSSGTKTASYTYDAVGNTKTRPTTSNGTQTLTWDAEGRLESSADSSGATSYLYDADGNRLMRRDPAGRTLYLPGQEVRLTTSTGAKTCTRYFIHAGQTVATRTAGKLSWLSGDHNGTTGITVDSLNQTVGIRRSMPFGEVRGSASNWLASFDKGFVGGTNDNTGLTHLGAREYDQVIGRFVSVDPLMDLANTRQWNAYAYANNSPVTFSDPAGLIGKCGVDGAGCSVVPNRDTYGADPNNASNPDNGGTTNWGGGFTTAYDTQTGDFYIGNYSLGKYSEQWAAPLRMQIIKQLQGDYANDRALYGELDEATLLSLLEVACSRLKDCERDGVFGDVIAANYAIMGGFAEGAIGALGAVASYKGLKQLSSKPKSMCANSFPGDTLVLMADGSTKPIDEVEVGDEVAASEPESPTVEGHVVTAVIVTDADKEYVDLTISTPEGEKVVRTTAHHPFYNASARKWVDAEQLYAGEQLSTPGNGRTQLTSTSHFFAKLRTYNLTVDSIHTYFAMAGSTPVLVHNTGPCPTGVSNSWHEGTFATPKESFKYHYDKHGAPVGVTPEQYLQDSNAWAARLAQPGGKTGLNAKRMAFDDGKFGVKYADPNGGMGGIVGPNGKVVSFWYTDAH